MKRTFLFCVGVAIFGLLGLLPIRVHGQSAAADNDGSILAGLESAVENKPDDLQIGSKYRQAVIQSAQYDRALKFFEKLIGEHPDSSNLHLNYAFAYVDKIPAAGSITQVLLANNALTEFTKSLTLKPSWIGYYSRGNSYMYWPTIFGRTPLGIADLEEAIKIQRADKKRMYYVRSYIALGDGHWKMEELDKAKAAWNEGLAQFPDSAVLKMRLSKQGDDLKALIESTYDVTKRVDTSLADLWADQGAERK